MLYGSRNTLWVTGLIIDSVHFFPLIYPFYKLDVLRSPVNKTCTRPWSTGRSVIGTLRSAISTPVLALKDPCVALQLCPPLQFFLFLSPMNLAFLLASNQSALWLCLHVTSQLGEGCSMSFVRFVFFILWKTCVWNSFGAFSPMGFWTILQKWSVFETVLGQRICPYVGELESLGQEWKHKPRAQIKSSKKDSSNKMQ